MGIIPFDMFSVEWDEATGDQKITCAEDPSVCPDMDTLEDMETIAIWGEGVGGKLNLYIKSISAVGCSSSSSSTPFSISKDNGGDDATSKSSPSTASFSSSASKRNSLVTMIMMGVVALTSTSFMLF